MSLVSHLEDKVLGRGYRAACPKCDVMPQCRGLCCVQMYLFPETGSGQTEAMQAEGAALARHVERRCWLGIVVANTAAASFVAISAVMAWPLVFPGQPFAANFALLLATGVLYLVASALSVLPLVVRRCLRPAVPWLVEGHQPTTREIERVATQPRRQATWMLAYWVVLLAWGTLFTIAIGLSTPTLQWFKQYSAVAAFAFIAWTLSYLFVERAIRPVLAIALSGAPSSEPRTMGVFHRLLVIWLASAGIPFVGLMLFIFGLDETQQGAVIPWVYFASVVALVAGVIATVVSSRAITDPLDKVRVGMQAIERGNLDVEIPVDEASEIGVLQMGFNRLAHGLRERERMREIFGHHVGADVAERAMSGDLSLGGERVEATAMFVDVIGSTALAERLPPEDVVADLNAFFSTVVRAVEAEGGFVNKFEGDGALCIFGAPVEHADHHERALRAARRLRSELHTTSERIDAAIGVSSGTVVAGYVGGANRYEYTLIGDPVNEAFRLCEEAKSRRCRTLASEASVRNAGPETASWHHAGNVLLRGRSTPTVAFEPASI